MIALPLLLLGERRVGSASTPTAVLTGNRYEVSLDWTMTTDYDVEVQRMLVGVFTEYHVVARLLRGSADHAASSYLDTSAQPGVTYRYRIAIHLDGGNPGSLGVGANQVAGASGADFVENVGSWAYSGTVDITTPNWTPPALLLRHSLDGAAGTTVDTETPAAGDTKFNSTRVTASGYVPTFTDVAAKTGSTSMRTGVSNATASNSLRGYEGMDTGPVLYTRFYFRMSAWTPHNLFIMYARSGPAALQAASVTLPNLTTPEIRSYMQSLNGYLAAAPSSGVVITTDTWRRVEFRVTPDDVWLRVYDTDDVTLLFDQREVRIGAMSISDLACVHVGYTSAGPPSVGHENLIDAVEVRNDRWPGAYGSADPSVVVPFAAFGIPL